MPITVTNAKPQVTASASPSNGQIPLTVSFTVSATDNEGIRRYAWDFDGDGRYDYRSTDTGSTTHIYRRVGVWRPALLVTDELGVSTKVVLPTTRVVVGRPGSPSVTLRASPSGGNAPLMVRFTASTSDPDGDTVTNWSWDFNGDGRYDQDTTEPTVERVYNAARTYYPKVRVTTSARERAEDSIVLPVQADIQLSMSKDNFSTDRGDTVMVNTVLSGAVNIGFNIENDRGRVVRTLIKPRRRRGREYRDVWDGRDDAGRIVADGAYYAVANYEIDGKRIRLDLRDSTGGVQGNPSRTQLDPSFSPFAGEPLKIDFQLDEASEVTAFIGLFNVNTRFLTFYQRKPLAAGEHTILWNGENADGRLVHPPPNDRFLFGIFRFSLPDNAVIVENAAEVTALSARPTIFVPGPNKSSVISFRLSKPAKIELSIVNADTGVVLGRRSYNRLTAGQKRIRWDARIRIANGGNTYVSAGRYRLGVTAIADNGSRSLTTYTVQQVYH